MHAIGVDPGNEMIYQAQRDGGVSKSGESVTFEVRAAEELSEMRKESVDLLTAGMAAHWFKMQDFWIGASKVVKSGGTVALWANSSFYCLPSTPNAKEVQKALSELEDGFLAPFESEGIKLSRNLYDHLLMPWDCNPDIRGFSKNQHVRHEWNRNGQVKSGEDEFFGGSDNYTLQELKDTMGCTSMVTKWREANPQLAETDQDCVVITIRKLANALGTTENSNVTIWCGCATSLLLFTLS